MRNDHLLEVICKCLQSYTLIFYKYVILASVCFLGFINLIWVLWLLLFFSFFCFFSFYFLDRSRMIMNGCRVWVHGVDKQFLISGLVINFHYTWKQHAELQTIEGVLFAGEGKLKVSLEPNSDCDPLILHNVIKSSRSLKVTVSWCICSDQFIHRQREQIFFCDWLHQQNFPHYRSHLSCSMYVFNKYRKSKQKYIYISIYTTVNCVLFLFFVFCFVCFF